MEWTFLRLKEWSPQLVLLAHLLLSIFTPPTHAESTLRITKRETALIDIIEDESLVLDSKNFYYDPIIIQQKAYTKYVNQKKQRGLNLGFRKQSEDLAKEAIVVSSLESHWAIPTPRGCKKRQFIVLKKAPTGFNEGSHNLAYFTSFVFVRDHLPNDAATRTFEVEGVNTVIEWDIWETRHKGFFPGWDTCEFTILFTCESINDMMIDAENALNDKLQAVMDKKAAGRRKKRNAAVKTTKLPPLTPIKFDPENDPGHYNDLYRDLDFLRKDKFHQGAMGDSSEKPGKKEDVSAKHHRQKRAFPAKGKKAAEKKATGKKKKGGLFGGLFGGKKDNEGTAEEKSARFEAKAEVSLQMGAGKGGFKKQKNLMKEAQEKKKKGLFGGIADMFGGIVKAGTKAVAGLVDAPLAMLGMDGIASGMADMVGGMVDAGTGMVGGLMDAPMEMLGGADGPLGPLLSAPLEMVSGIVEAGTGIIGGVVEAGANIATGLAQAGTGLASGMMEAGVGMVGGLIEAPMKMLTGDGEGGGALGALTGLIGAPMEMMSSMLTGEGSPLAALSGTLEGLVSAPMELMSGLLEAPMKMLGGEGGGGGALGAISSLISAPMEAFAGIIGGTNPMDMITGLMQAPMDLMGGVAQMMGGLATAPMEMLGSLTAGGNPLEALTSLASAPMAAIGGVAEMLTGLASVPLDMVSQLAGGAAGVVSGGLSALTSLIGAPLEMFGDLASNPLGAVMEIGGKLLSPIAALTGANPGGAEGEAGMEGSELSGSGPLSILTRMTADGLEAMKPLTALLGPASGIMDGIIDSIKGLATGVSTDMLGSLMGGVEGGVGLMGSISNIISGMLNGGASLEFKIGAGVGGGAEGGAEAGAEGGAEGEAEAEAGARRKRFNKVAGPLKMASQLLGPVSKFLDPVDQVVIAAASVCTGIPQMGVMMGQSVLGTVATTMDSLGPSGMMQTMGLGGVLDVSKGTADAVLAMGESLFSSWDIVGNGLVKGAAESLSTMGYPKDFALLAALGANLASNVEMLDWKDSSLGIRLHDDLQGGNLNGGKHRSTGAGPTGNATSKDYKKWAAMGGTPPVAVQLYGITYTGAGSGRDFFFPMRSILRGKFKPDDSEETLPGTFYPGVVPGKYDLFFPDNAADAAKFHDRDGVLIPESFVQPHRDAAIGIEGRLSTPNFFKADAHSKLAVFHPDQAKAYWVDPWTGHKVPKRPVISKTSMPIYYGYFFQGILGSPHLFLKEGEGLTGFFVPDDPDNPEYKETPRGSFFPSHPAGHATFELENGDDFETVKEIRGAFLSDASHFAVAIGGVLVATANNSGFSFILDKPAVDFTYIKGHPSMANIWSPMLTPGEWTYSPPPMSPVPETTPAENDEKIQAALAQAAAAVGLEKAPKEFYGTKIVSQKASVFLPDKFAVEGVFIPHVPGSKIPPMQGTVTAGRPHTPWVAKITSGATALPDLATCLFQPNGFQAEDALMGKLTLSGDEGTILFDPRQAQSEYFWTFGEEIWTPRGFVDMDVKDAAAKVEAEKAALESGKVPGMALKVASPEKPANYYFGRKKAESPEMDEVVLNDLPRKLHYGYYLIQEGATDGPLFLPEVGGATIFTPDGADSVKGQYIPKGAAALGAADGSAGTLNTETVSGAPSKESVKGTFSGEKFECTPACEIMPGWKYATTQIAGTPGPATRKDLTYRLVDLGGGYIGTVVEGSAALDDANNPLFQEFLHYKAHRDGGVNPWGDPIILDPIERQAGTDEVTSGLGQIKPIQASAPKTSELILSHFFLRNWEWPMSIEEGAAAGEAAALPALTISGKGNVVNMMDFRMYLLRKYNCKRAKLDAGKTAILLAGIGSDRFINLIKEETPLAEWLEAMKATKETLFLPNREGVLGVYSAMHSLEVADVEPYIRKKGTPAMFEMKDWMKLAYYKDWGVEGSCDEIELSDFEVAQAGASADDVVSGVSLGLQLVSGVGSKLNWPDIASKLVVSVKKTMNQPPGEVLDDISTADLLGAVKNRVKANLMKRQSTQVNSGESTTKAPGRRRRRKREVDAFKKRLAKRKKRAADDNGEEAKNMPGWRTQYKADADFVEKVTIVDEGRIFYGLGNCKQEKAPDYALLESKLPSNVIEYYLSILRVECMDDSRERIRVLFNDGLLEFGDDGASLDVPEYSPMIHTVKLEPDEIKKLSVAFEMSAFTKTYQKLRGEGFTTTGYIEEPNCIMSRSVGFLTEMALYYISQARNVCPTHSVRLTRNLIKTLRTALTKVNQDELTLNFKCKSDCPLDKKLAQGDKFRLVSLVEFIIHGLRPFYKGEATLKDSFYKFVGENKEAIQERVVDFARMYQNALLEA